MAWLDLSIAHDLSGHGIIPAPFRVAAQHEAQGADKAAKTAKITKDEARKIALEAAPGKVANVEIEKKLGANRYVVEVIAKADGAEIDVIIDMESGKVLAIDK